MCFHINSLTAPELRKPTLTRTAILSTRIVDPCAFISTPWEIGDSSRTPETYFDTDRHPEHEDCRPMCFHINSLGDRGQLPNSGNLL